MCNCLCEINHPSEMGICTGNWDTIVIFSVPEVLSGPVRGRREVQMCDPCAAATYTHKRDKEEGRA